MNFLDDWKHKHLPGYLFYKLFAEPIEITLSGSVLSTSDTRLVTQISVS
jgi:hypothetical protein